MLPLVLQSPLGTELPQHYDHREERRGEERKKERADNIKGQCTG